MTKDHHDLVRLTPELLANNSNSGYLFITKEAICTYLFLREEYKKTKKSLSTNYLFRAVFSSFYGMGFLTDKQKDMFFYGVESCDDMNLKNLSKSIGKAGILTFQFSFMTKILNLDNPDLNPIYDSHVAKCLNLKPLISNSKFEGAVEIYDELIKYYNHLQLETEVKECLNQFDKSFPDIMISQLPAIKKIDFLVWAMGKYLSKNKVVLPIASVTS